MVDFNPRSPCGERHAVEHLLGSAEKYFNPRSPCGERLWKQVKANTSYGFQSTLPLRGATGQAPGRDQSGAISIHAPLAGSDLSPRPVRLLSFISIHAPLAGSDGPTPRQTKILNIFQSTLPLRGATPAVGTNAPLFWIFQSTLPLRGATPPGCAGIRKGRISIHAPLAGSDNTGSTAQLQQEDFNPRSPCGERLRPDGSRRGLHGISIHAPLAGSDRCFGTT